MKKIILFSIAYFKYVDKKELNKRIYRSAFFKVMLKNVSKNGRYIQHIEIIVWT